jgi:hypothetical protein
MTSTEKPAYIYALVDPFTREIRYIGKSIRPKERLTNECNERVDTHRSHWIQSLLSKGKRPEQIILEIVPPGRNWQERERYWIAEGKRRGWPLVNGTSGGDGVPDLCPEAKEKMLKTWTGRKHKPETLEKIGAASKGRTHNEEYKEMMRQLMREREFTPQHRKRLSDAVRKFTPELAEQIRQRIANGEKVKDIAAEYGAHRTTISKIKKGQEAYEAQP